MESLKLLFIALLVLSASCRKVAEHQSSELEEMPRNLVACLKGGSCAGFKVKARSAGAPIFSNAEFTAMWNSFPNSKDTKLVKKQIGGEINQDWITNTCVVRTSRALNYSGNPSHAIPVTNGLFTRKGADGKRYALRVIDFAKYMLATYGRPNVIAADRASFRKTIANRRGIVLFDRRGWTDANGHFDMWNGSNARHAEYIAASDAIFIWE